MIFSARKLQESLDGLEASMQYGLTRRDVLRLLALGLPLIAGGTLVTGCGETSSSPSSVTVLASWQGAELASFLAMVAPFTQQTGIRVQINPTEDVFTRLNQALLAHNPPDIAILPNPAEVQALVRQHSLIPLDPFLDTKQLSKDYGTYLIDLCRDQKKTLYAIFVKGNNKGTIWYSPRQLNADQIPTTWKDLITLSNQIASSGKYPWSMGVESGATSGWPAADWVAEIYLKESGPDLYDQWVSHTIPWTHESVNSAFQMFGQIVHSNHYINGAPQSILTTGYKEASYLPFNTPPDAYLYYLGDFTEGFLLTKPGSHLQAETDFNFFPFPTITPQFQGGLTVGADLAVALRNTSEVGQLVGYLATAPAQEIWARQGGLLLLNKSVDVNVYLDPVAQASASMFQGATTIRFGAGDLMPPVVQLAFWNGLLTYIRDANQLNAVLQQIETTAQQAYYR